MGEGRDEEDEEKEEEEEDGTSSSTAVEMNWDVERGVELDSSCCGRD